MMNSTLRCLAARPMARIRLVCVPYAGGGSAVFRGWRPALPASIEPFAVQLPGREDRIREQPWTEWRQMIAEVQAALRALPAMPTAYFGHSLGAVVALELARAEAAGPPLHLFCAARPWPGAPTGERPDMECLDDDAFIDAMAAQYGSLNEALADPEIRALVIPCLRADLALLGSYRHRPQRPVGCPLTVYTGSDDPITTATDLELWRRETSSGFRVARFAGDHFFLHGCQQALVDDIVATLGGTATSTVAGSSSAGTG